MLSAFSVFVLFVVLFALIFVILAVQRVPQGSEWTVERFGRYVRTLEPGLALIVPVVDRVGARMSMMETVLEVPSQSVITRDNAQTVERCETRLPRQLGSSEVGYRG